MLYINDGADIGCHFRPTAFGAKMHARERERERETHNNKHCK